MVFTELIEKTPKTSAIKGCARKCPCRLWVNCSYYNNLKHKKDTDERYQDIEEWYKTNFRDSEIPAIIVLI